jgi:hypothetical protein
MEITYLSEIIIALSNLGGYASLKEINNYIEARNILPSIRTNINWKRNVSAVIQRHCSMTKSYLGAEDIFYSVYGLGEGYWGLLSMKKDDIDINPIESRIQNEILSNDLLKETEKQMLLKARRGQGIFREKIINRYKNCIITGISDKRLLLASHIKPWRAADNFDRLSEENGLLLSPLYDKMFDIGLISFKNNMQILISSEIDKINLSKIFIDESKVYITSPSYQLQRNLEYHRNMIFIE